MIRLLKNIFSAITGFFSLAFSTASAVLTFCGSFFGKLPSYVSGFFQFFGSGTASVVALFFFSVLALSIFVVYIKGVINLVRG